MSLKDSSVHIVLVMGKDMSSMFYTYTKTKAEWYTFDSQQSGGRNKWIPGDPWSN